MTGHVCLAGAPAGRAVPAVAWSDEAPRSIDPDGFGLVDAASGRRSTLRALSGATATLVFFSSHECPVALAYEQELASIASVLEGRGVKLVAVSTHDTGGREAIQRHCSPAAMPRRTSRVSPALVTARRR